MSIQVYNTLTRRKSPLETEQPGKVGMYLCGPTVYKPSHIGHAVGPVIFDAIKRYLVHRGYDVNWVVNITDVDDKLIVEAGKQGVTTFQLAERITKDYLAAMAELHVDTIDIMPKASEHMGEIIEIIETLIEKDYAYESAGDVYFDVRKDDDYGKLSNRNLDEQEGHRELQSGEKRNPGDFALWKAAKADEPDEVKFSSPWGDGRPGWHIECSAMAGRYLGKTFDIHGGGMDLVFPHHENEVAQSESAYGQTFARYWMHHGLTRVNTKKISKSDASPEMQAALTKMTLHNLLDAYPGELIRYFILNTHYRSPIEYSEAEIESRRKGLVQFYRLFERVERATGASPYEGVAPLDARPEIADGELRSHCDGQQAAFEQAMDDDFNTGTAIASMFEFAAGVNRFVEQNGLDDGGTDVQKQDLLNATRHLVATARLIGLFIDPPAKSGGDNELTDKVMRVLIEVRAHLRGKKDFETADLIRDRLAENKIVLEDRGGETNWRVD